MREGTERHYVQDEIRVRPSKKERERETETETARESQPRESVCVRDV